MTLTPDEVDSIDDEHSAARAWLELHHERSQPGLPQHRQVENKAATAKLEQSWPGAGKLAAIASDQDLGGLSPGMKRTRDAHRKSAGVSSQQARSQRRGRATAPPATKSAAPAARPSSSSRRGGGRRGPSVSGGDVADWAAPGALSVGQMIWQTFGWGVGLSVLYLFLTKGTGAVDAISRGITNTVGVIVNPLADPLSPAATAAAAAPASSAPAPGTPGAVLAGTQKPLGGFPTTTVTTTTGVTTP